MAVTAGQLNRATLARQGLLHRERIGVVEAVRRAVAIQAQEPAAPYIALWNRIEGFDGSELDRAFAEHEVLKGSVVRLTLHAVTAADHPSFYAAMLPYLRASRLNDRRFTSEGLTTEAADALLPALLELLAETRPKAEVEALCGSPRMWWALRTFAPLVHAPTGPPWSFGPRPQYVAAPTVAGAPIPDAAGTAAGRAALVLRYLEGFGPASEADIATFTMFRKPAMREALEGLDGQLVRLEGPDGAELLDVPGGVIPKATVKAPPRLLGMWEQVLLAYADRSRIIPDEYRPLVIRRNGDVLPTVLVDGHVAGVWRVVEGAVEIIAFDDLTAPTWKGLTAEAERLATFLAGRDPRVFARHHHWWDDLPGGDRRILAAP